MIDRPDSSRVGARLILDAIPHLLPDERHMAWDAIVSREDWIPKLFDRLDAGDVQVSDLTVSHRELLRQHQKDSIRERAEMWFQPTADRQEAWRKYQTVLESAGNLDAGKGVFRRVCATCHQLDGFGRRRRGHS